MVPQYENEKDGKISKRKGLNGLQMVPFENCLNAPSFESPWSNFEFGRIPLFPLLALWGNKKWLPSMKVKMMGNFQNKRGLKGCKWSSLNAQGTENPLSHSVLELEEFLFPINYPLG